MCISIENYNPNELKNDIFVQNNIMWETKNSEVMLTSHKFVLHSYALNELKTNKINKEKKQFNITDDGIKHNIDHLFYEIDSKLAVFNDLIDTKLN